MYQCSKDVINIEEAKQYNSISNKKKENMDSSFTSIGATYHSNKQNANDISANYYLLLHNKAKLKETCHLFIVNNDMNHNINYYKKYIFNYYSPEILLHESFLNSQFALTPIISRRSEDDE